MKKLVRDGIPTLLKDEQYKRMYRLRAPNLLPFIREKIKEEASELAEARTRSAIIEEMADVFEICLAMAKIYRISPKEVEECRLEKLSKKGGFDKGIIVDFT
jgi:predicted house-cleaning noncanonical NTP pyrophosphatase (MazG superfamily)